MAAALLCGAGLAVANAPVAHAQNAGQVCMFSAPSGADGLGHIGWGFRRDDGTWRFGSTDNPGGAWSVPPSSDPAVTGSWTRDGGWDQMLAAFRSGESGHGAGFYTRYRCDTTPDDNSGGAAQQAADEATNGYSLPTNNCLTKAVDIFKAYSTRLANLPDPAWQVPNQYFTVLPTGWSSTTSL
ncbi:hypothetical protein [Streptacidiphilus jiangxiensis]|uniref:hypothetical protein n=1 Tax=Streptacidiphilus jiangxiensis TaxID=235985 RepID=UPI0005A6D702|nr:hypothetical protein [Streptacidiphilus jiangxiensis]